MADASGNKVEIAVVAPSSLVPSVELEAGAARLREAGLGVSVHPQCHARHFTFAGTDAQRATAFYESASNPRFNVIWCARGGYGSTRILPLLRSLQDRHGIPNPKLLVGYSDATALHAFVRREWGWHSLHAAMPASMNFGQNPDEWAALLDAVNGRRPGFPWEQKPLSFLTNPPALAVAGELAGGTLTILGALAGTPDALQLRGKILFIEDVNEAWYRIDRMVTQLANASVFDGLQAIVLGNFHGCTDEPPTGLESAGSPKRIPLRAAITEEEAVKEIFGTLGERLSVPVARGLPAGHGPRCWPLPLSASYRLHATGRLELIDWEWLRQPAEDASGATGPH